ncbi:hypothetical protein Tco_1563780 [Tanacetum coccineum]
MFVIGINEPDSKVEAYDCELKEKISRLTEKNSDADPTLDLKALVSQNKDLTAKLNALHDLNEGFRAENAKVKQHYKELECFHHGYLNGLKDTLIHLWIVERLEVNYIWIVSRILPVVALLSKRSQELLANASASCPKAVNKRDKFIATTPVTKKKRVTFADPLETSGNNTPKHVKQQSVQPTNVPILLPTGSKHWPHSSAGCIVCDPEILLLCKKKDVMNCILVDECVPVETTGVGEGGCGTSPKLIVPGVIS